MDNDNRNMNNVTHQKSQILQEADDDLESDDIMKDVLSFKLRDLEKEYPEWFLYSDTLGERPVDGMIKEMRRRGIDRQLEQSLEGHEEARNRSRNRGHARDTLIAPEYMQEELQQNPDRKFGRLM